MQTREFTINSVTDPELAAALAEAKQREEEANLRLAKLAAERAELEAATQRAEAKVEEATQKAETELAEAERAAELAEAEARKAVAQSVAEAERAAELAEAEARKVAAQNVADAERAAELAEAKRREEEENLQVAKLAAERAEAEVAAQKAEAEAARLRREAEETEEQRRVEAEARQIAAQKVADAEREAELAEAEARRIAAQNVADAERAAELAEAKRKEEEENLQAAKLAAERAEAEAVAQKAEAEAARLRREAEEAEAEARRKKEEEERRLAAEEAERLRLEAEAEEQRKVEAEARRIAAQNVADAERAAELAEAEARKAAAQSVADAERAAELAEAKRKEEEANLQVAKLAAERAEAEAATRKAEAEAEAAKAHKAEEQLKQEKVQIAAEKVQKASEKAADKEKQKAEVKEKKKLAKKRKKKYRSYRDFSVVKLILWIVGILALVVVLYVFATPISKGFHIGKNAVDTFLAEKLPKVAETLKIKGNGYDMPIFKDDSVYLTEDAENYVETAVWPRGYTASVVRLKGTQYICVEGNGLKMYYLNEIAENDSKHVYLEKGDVKAMYFKEYSFDAPESLCPVRGVFNEVGIEQYLFPATEVCETQILDAETLKECRITLQAEDMPEVLNFIECHEDGQNVRISMTSEEIPYAFWVMKKGGLSLKDGYKFVLHDIRYETGVKKISFEAQVTSAGQYLGKVNGIMDYVAGGYVPADVIFYAYADDEFVSGQVEAITATHYKGAEMERVEVTGENGERLLIPAEDAKKE